MVTLTTVPDTDPDTGPALHDVDAERAVLGAMLMSPTAIQDVADLVAAADFYAPAHETLYRAVSVMDAAGTPVDAVAVAAELTKRGELGRVGGPAYLHTLLSSVPTAANAGYYARIVHERAVLHANGICNAARWGKAVWLR